MRFVLIGVGSLGDVMPQLSLAAELSSRGQRAVVVGLAPYADLAVSLGIDYISVPADTTALWPTDPLRRSLALAQPGIMFTTMLARFAKSAPVVNKVLIRIIRPGDVVVTGLVTAGAARLLGRELGSRTIPVLFAPLLPSTSTASSALAPALGGAALALLGSSFMWQLSQQLATAHTRDMAKRLAARPVRVFAGDPVLMATSPTLTPRSPLWPGWIRQTGWINPDAATASEPLGDDLMDFLRGRQPPILMTFGTCPVVSPTRDVEMFLTAARSVGRRVVLQSDALPGGPVNDWVHNAPGVPHGLLMRHLQAVVHHGGAGTTHAAMAAGVPSMVVPHLGDQGYYARRVQALGAGPRGVPRWRLTTSVLTRQLRTLIVGASAQRFAEAASRVSTALGAEDGCGAAVDELERLSGA
ncbi:MAG: glycosyltransferase [Arachnia sp.]